MKNFITLIRFIIGGFLVGYVLAQTLNFVHDVIDPVRLTHCGTITFKGSYDQANKHSSSIEFVMVVDYEDSGKEDVNVSASTWSSYSVGQRICFTTVNPTKKTVPAAINFIVGGCGTIVLLFISVLFLYSCIAWVFGGSTPYEYFKNMYYAAD